MAQSETKAVDWDRLPYQMVYRRVLDQLVFVKQCKKKRLYKAQFLQQKKDIAALQQTIERQAQLLEQHGLARLVSDALVTSRLRTPVKRKHLMSPPVTPLKTVEESPQTGPLSLMGVKEIIPPSLTSPSRIPVPSSLRARGVLCVHGRASMGCALCVNSDDAKPTQQAVKVAKVEAVDGTHPSNVPSTAINKPPAQKLDVKPTGNEDSGSVQFHYGDEDVDEKPDSAHFGWSRCSSVKDKENRVLNEQTTNSNNKATYSERTADILKAVHTIPPRQSSQHSA